MSNPNPNHCAWYNDLECYQPDEGNCWCQEAEDHCVKTGQKMSTEEARLLLAIGTK